MLYPLDLVLLCIYYSNYKPPYSVSYHHLLSIRWILQIIVVVA